MKVDLVRLLIFVWRFVEENEIVVSVRENSVRENSVREIRVRLW